MSDCWPLTRQSAQYEGPWKFLNYIFPGTGDHNQTHNNWSFFDHAKLSNRMLLPLGGESDLPPGKVLSQSFKTHHLPSECQKRFKWSITVFMIDPYEKSHRLYRNSHLTLMSDMPLLGFQMCWHFSMRTKYASDEYGELDSCSRRVIKRLVLSFVIELNCA